MQKWKMSNKAIQQKRKSKKWAAIFYVSDLKSYLAWKINRLLVDWKIAYLQT